MDRSETSITISLTDDLADFVRSSVTSGRYRSSADVVRDALRLLEEQDRHAADVERLRHAWAEGETGGDYQPVSLDDVKAAGRKRRTGTS